MSEHRLDFYMNYFGLLTNIFLLAYQLSAISLLRVIDNGLGDAVFGGVVDYAHLAADQKSSVPSQGQKPLEHLKVISNIVIVVYLSVSNHHMKYCKLIRFPACHDSLNLGKME